MVGIKAWGQDAKDQLGLPPKAPPPKAPPGSVPPVPAAPAPVMAPAPVGPPTVDFGNQMINPAIKLDASGYPISPGYQSIRQAGGDLNPEFKVSAPQLSDMSSWSKLKEQQQGNQDLRRMDTARQAGMAQLPPQGAAALSSGSRGIAALQGMNAGQSGALGAALGSNQDRMGTAEALLGKNFDLAKAQGGLSQAAQAANIKAQLGDMGELNKWKIAQYENEISKQQGKDMAAAIAAGNKPGGPSDLQRLVRDPVTGIAKFVGQSMLGAANLIPGVKELFNQVHVGDGEKHDYAADWGITW